MLEDRYYMRSGGFQPQRSATFVLMVANTAIFVIQSLLDYWAKPVFNAYYELCALSVNGLSRGYIWQLFTFQFMHGGLLHLIVNLLAIYFFGRALEEILGLKRYLTMYFGCGVAGGLLQIVFELVFSPQDGRSVVGASAGAFGLVAAFATLFPEQRLTLLLFFVIPVSMRARSLLWISLGLAIFGIVVPNDSLADAAHLGGLLTGIAYVHGVVKEHWNFDFSRFNLPWKRARKFATPSRQNRFQTATRPASKDDLESAEFISKEVDPILDKISAHGIQSLSDRERRILEAARSKMAKR